MKEKTEQRIVGLFVLMAAILITVAIASVKTIHRARESSDWVNHTHAVIMEVNAVISSLHAGDADLRTFLLTGDNRDQGAYRSSYAEMVEHLQIARALTRSGIEAQSPGPEILELEKLIKARIDFTRDVAHAREKGGLDAARAELAAHPGLESIGKIQRLSGAITSSENVLLSERDKESRLQAQQTQNIVYAGLVADFILLAFVFALVRDDLATRRLNARLLEEANAILEAKVLERTADLVHSNAALTQENLERRWANQSVEHQLRYSQLIINSIHELVFVTSRALNISRINPAVTAVSQWEPQELISQAVERVLQLTPEISDGAPRNPIDSALRTGREIQDGAGLLICKSGRTLPMRYSVIPLRDQDKVVGGVITVRLQG